MYTRGVMLLPLDSQAYRRHLARHTLMARANSAEPTPDFRSQLTQNVEDGTRQELQRHMAQTKYRVLRWEQLSPSRRWSVHFRELDGVYQLPSGATVLLEVKGSASRASLSSGLKQLDAARATLSVTHPRTIGLMVVANLGTLVEGFGEQAATPLSEYFAQRNISVLQWPPVLPGAATSEVFASIPPESVVSGWLAQQSDESA